MHTFPVLDVVISPVVFVLPAIVYGLIALGLVALLVAVTVALIRKFRRK